MTAWLAGGTLTEPAPLESHLDTPWLAGSHRTHLDEWDVRRIGSDEKPTRRVAIAASCRLAASAGDLAAHRAIRRGVFVVEQRVFDGSDRDVHDDDPATLHVLGLVDGVAAGTVRLFPLDPLSADEPDWQGDRLAVLAPFRSAGLGAPLVRFAVATAAARGGRRMVAHVQVANRTFFRRLGWTQCGEPEIYVGRPHLRMEIDLGAAGRGV